MVRDQRLVRRGYREELVVETLWVAEAQGAIGAGGLVPVLREPLLPEGQGIVAGDPPHDAVDHSRARSALGDARVLEERDVGAWVTGLVGVEEVIDGRVVLVD